MAEQEPEGRLSKIQKFLQHALDCLDPNCILPLCVNTKLKLKHSQICRNKLNCAICQEMKSLASKHSESCTDFNCRVPFCMEAKLEMVGKAAQIDLSDCLEVILQENESLGFNTEDERAPPESNTKSRFLQPKFPPLRQATLSHTPILEAASNQKEITQMFPILLEKDMSNCPPMESVVYSPPLYSPFSESPRPCLDQSARSQSTVTMPTEMANYQKGDVVEPYLAPNQSTLTTSTQVTRSPLFVERQKNAAAMQEGSDGLPSPLEQNVSRQQLSQNAKTQKSIAVQLNAACASVSSQTTRAPHNATSTVDRNMGAVNKANDTQRRLLLRVRLMNALSGLISLVMKKKTRGELLVCLKWLRNALDEIKRLDQSKFEQCVVRKM